MGKHYVDYKTCKACHESKDAESFHRDRSRKDGLKDLCKDCIGDYQPTRSRTDFTGYRKTCSLCLRELDHRRFLWEQHSSDKLSSKCRTCKSWKGKKPPTLEEIVNFEVVLKRILRTAAERVENPSKDRAIFENYVVKSFDRSGLSENWKYPIWISSHTILE